MLRPFLVASGIVCAVALDPKYIKRTESSPATSSCESVRDIPEDVSRLLKLNTSWYKQYTEAYGIPIMGSAKVSKQALTRACYVVRFMFSGEIILIQIWPNGTANRFFLQGGKSIGTTFTKQPSSLPSLPRMRK